MQPPRNATTSVRKLLKRLARCRGELLVKGSAALFMCKRSSRHLRIHYLEGEGFSFPPQLYSHGFVSPTFLRKLLTSQCREGCVVHVRVWKWKYRNMEILVPVYFRIHGPEKRFLVDTHSSPENTSPKGIKQLCYSNREVRPFMRKSANIWKRIYNYMFPRNMIATNWKPAYKLY